jgi:hypothetical protein
MLPRNPMTGLKGELMATYCPSPKPPLLGWLRAWRERRQAQRGAALRRAKQDQRRALCARVWAVQIAAATLRDTRRT